MVGLKESFNTVRVTASNPINPINPISSTLPLSLLTINVVYRSIFIIYKIIKRYLIFFNYRIISENKIIIN